MEEDEELEEQKEEEEKVEEETERRKGKNDSRMAKIERGKNCRPLLLSFDSYNFATSRRS